MSQQPVVVQQVGMNDGYDNMFRRRVPVVARFFIALAVVLLVIFIFTGICMLLWNWSLRELFSRHGESYLGEATFGNMLGFILFTMFVFRNSCPNMIVYACRPAPTIVQTS